MGGKGSPRDTNFTFSPFNFRTINKICSMSKKLFFIPLYKTPPCKKMKMQKY